MKTISSGVSDFKKIIDNDLFYVDKSLLIKDFIDYQSDVTLITRPRRFGKSLNLSMLKYFFERKLESGLTSNIDDSISDNSYLFKNLKYSGPLVKTQNQIFLMGLMSVPFTYYTSVINA